MTLWRVLRAWWASTPTEREALASVAEHVCGRGDGELSAQIGAWSALPPLQRRVIHYATELAAHRFWPDARHAVERTAHYIGLNKPHVWEELMNTVQSQPQWAENQWRHVHALKLLHKRVSHSNAQMRNPDLNLLTELAYLSYTIDPTQHGDHR